MAFLCALSFELDTLLLTLPLLLLLAYGFLTTDLFVDFILEMELLEAGPPVPPVGRILVLFLFARLTVAADEVDKFPEVAAVLSLFRDVLEPVAEVLVPLVVEGSLF